MDRTSVLATNRGWLKRRKGRGVVMGYFPAFCLDILQTEGVELLRRADNLLIFSLAKQCLVGLGYGASPHTIDVLFMNVRQENRGAGMFRKAMDMICRLADKYRLSLRANVARYELLNDAVWSREFWFGVGHDEAIPDRKPVDDEREANLRWYDSLSRNWSFEWSGPDMEITRQPQ